MQSNAEIASLNDNKTKSLPPWIPQKEVSSVLSQTKHVRFYRHLSDTGSPHIWIIASVSIIHQMYLCLNYNMTANVPSQQPK